MRIDCHHFKKLLHFCVLGVLWVAQGVAATAAVDLEATPALRAGTLADVCNRATQLLDAKFDRVGTISDSVFQRFGDPIERARALQDELHINASALGREDYPDGGTGVFWRSNKLTDLRAYRHPLDTIMIHSRYGLVPPGRRFVVEFDHGWTGMESHSGGGLTKVNFMVSRKMGGSYAVIKDPKTGNFVPGAAVTKDLPFHGAGPRNPELHSLEAGLDWRLQFSDYMKHQAPELPLIKATLSGESLMAALLNYRYPDLYAAQIYVAPVHPKAGLVEGLEGYILDKSEETATSANPLTFRWMESVLGEMHALPKEERWWESQHPLGNPAKPLLVLVGSEDRQTPVETRREFQRLAAMYPDRVFYVEIQGAGHNVFATKSDEDRERAQLAWKHVYHFIRSQVMHDPNTNPMQ